VGVSISYFGHLLLIDVLSFFGVQSIDDSYIPFLPQPRARRDEQLNSTIATSSETSSLCSSRSAIQPSSDGGTDEDNMATLRPSNCRGYDIADFSGLEESVVDSDDEDISSVNTEVIKLCLGGAHTWTWPPFRCCDLDINPIDLETLRF